MYNRYVPQADGSYHRNRIHDAPPPKAPPPPIPPKPIVPPPCPPPQTQQNAVGLGNFFRQLIPQGLDTADLLIILLILLMAGDCEEDRNYALLTLALYFFM